MLRALFDQLLHSSRTFARVPKLGLPFRNKGFDVRSLEPTPRMTESEKVERYANGRFAAMTDSQAGL